MGHRSENPVAALAVRARTYAAVVAFAPLLAAQGWLVRTRTPVLPEAAGPRSGVVGSGPTLRFAVIGESTAAGVGVTHQRAGLAVRLAEQLGGRVDVAHLVAPAIPLENAFCFDRFIRTATPTPGRRTSRRACPSGSCPVSAGSRTLR